MTVGAPVAADRLLDAARDELGRAPWAAVTMAGVAEGAGVSRQTLYNTFGTREELARALVLREVETFLGAVENALTAAEGDAEKALQAAFQAFLDGASHNPLVRAVVVDDDRDLLALVFGRELDVVGVAAGRLGAAITVRWPQAAPEDVSLLADALVRVAISHAAVPGGPWRDVAVEVRRLFGPFITAALSR
jgi:AcrR family transcriptional regulator